MEKLTKPQKEMLDLAKEGKNTLEELMERSRKAWGPTVTILDGLITKGYLTQPNPSKNEFFKK
jgi:hypothetical protein